MQSALSSMFAGVLNTFLVWYNIIFYKLDFFFFFFSFFFICLFLRRGKLFFLDNFLSMCIYRLLRNIQNKSVYKINSYKVKKKKSFFIGKLKLLCFMTLVVISKSCYFHNSLPGLCGNLGNLPQLCYTCQFRNYGRECRTLSRISDFAFLYQWH